MSWRPTPGFGPPTGPARTEPQGVAFYDLDGTLTSSNIVRRYAFLARSLPSRTQAALRYTKLLVSVPALVGLDFYSRSLFNEIFYREYRGMKKEWLWSQAEALFDAVLRPTIYPGAKALVEADRKRGFRVVLVSGELDFALAPVVRFFGFDRVISNSLVYDKGAATGKVTPPLIAEGEKVTAMLRVCQHYKVTPSKSKAYSDSFSDLPMLEAVGKPTAVNPDLRLRRVALARGWPVLNLKGEIHVHHRHKDGTVAGL